MKNLLFVAFIASGLFLASCGEKNTEAAADSVSVDTVAADSVAADSAAVDTAVVQ